jgi:succinate dehydrogenase hydrophobic anchor subunit
MCSNCSGDDLRPESFSTFGISSPQRDAIFAAQVGAKRKQYRTPGTRRYSDKDALMQGINDVRILRWFTKIIKLVDSKDFVNLNLRGNGAESTLRNSVAGFCQEPFEIRVLPDAIIEVYASSEPVRELFSQHSMRKAFVLSPWEESRAARGGMRRTVESYRRTQRAKYFIGYAAVIIAAAAIVWCAI